MSGTGAQSVAQTYVIILDRGAAVRVVDHDPTAEMFERFAPYAGIIVTEEPERWTDPLAVPTLLQVRVISTADPDTALKVGRRQIDDWRWGMLS